MKSMRVTLLGALLLLCGVGSVVAQGVPTAGAPASSVVPSARPVAAPAAMPSATATGMHDLTRADVDTWLEGYLPYALRAAAIPGAVVTVVKDGKILTARGFGFADVAKRTPVDPARTLFRIGSVSKLFTWTAAMQLVEQGKLDLDGDVNTYLDFRIPPRDGKPITLRQLMTHSAGFEDVAKGIISYDPHYLLPLDRYLKRDIPKRIFAPGTTPAYSNWGTALTAYIVQRVSGEDFDTYLERHIFTPLNMRNATFRQPVPARLAAQLATGYKADGVVRGFEYIGPAPAGSASVSGTDMARFMIAHLQQGELDGQRTLSAQAAATMHRSPLDKVDPFSLMPPLNRMELGFFETNVNGREVIGHLGDVEAFHTSLHLFVNDRVGLYVSFNSPGKAGAVQALRTAVFQDFADRYFPDIAPAAGLVDGKTAADHARMMAGNWIASRRVDTSFLSAVYWLTGQATVGVGSKGELLIPSLLNAGGQPRQWTEVSPFVWREVNGHERLAAKVVDGKIVRWTFDLAAPFEIFERVPASVSAVWLLPAIYVGLAILLLTFLQWPAATIARRIYQAPRPVAGPTLRTARAAKLMAGLTVALLVTWAVTAISALGDPDALAGGKDGIFWALQIASAILFVGMVGVAGWNAWLAWRDGRGWTRRVWAVLVLFAGLLFLYVAVRFDLMAMTVNY